LLSSSLNCSGAVVQYHNNESILFALQVLYHAFTELSEIGAENIIATDYVLAVVSFFVVVICSLAIGTLLGLAGAWSVRFTHHLRVLEPLIVCVIPYLAFLVSEMFHFSGILSYMLVFLFTPPRREGIVKYCNEYVSSARITRKPRGRT